MQKDSGKVLTPLKQVDAVVLSVYLLGGASKSIDTEEIAVKSHEISRGMFSWRHYPEQINLELVRVALSDAKKKPYGSLLQGSGRDGWRLTTAGLKWCQEKASFLKEHGVPTAPTRRQAGSIDARRADRERARIAASDAWSQWITDAAISHSAAQLLFRIDTYSSRSMAEAKIVRLLAMFQSDNSLVEFLQVAGKVILEERNDK
jgi:hypothetical protein